MDFSLDQSLPRGIRNNNPGNLRAGESWQGITGQDAAGFLIFKDDTWGIRALALDLSNKYNKDGLTTITDIITKYAPPSENNVPAYINAVSSSLGIDPDEDFTLDQPTLHGFVRAIMDHENGGSSQIPDSDIDQGIAMISGGVAQIAQAAAIAAQSNPGSTALVVGGIILLLFLAFRER